MKIGINGEHRMECVEGYFAPKVFERTHGNVPLKHFTDTQIHTHTSLIDIILHRELCSSQKKHRFINEKPIFRCENVPLGC